MQKKAAIGIVVAVIILAAVIPVGYAVAQRAAVTNLEFKVNRFELADVDFSETQTYNSLRQVVGSVENPSVASLDDLIALDDQINALSSPELTVLDFLINTKLVFSLYLDVHNPSFLEATIDRADAKVRINGYELAKP
ncbi:MAG: hypothetical protein ACREBU_06255, partial [Nitrososphaera sp.]